MPQTRPGAPAAFDDASLPDVGLYARTLADVTHAPVHIGDATGQPLFCNNAWMGAFDGSTEPWAWSRRAVSEGDLEAFQALCANKQAERIQGLVRLQFDGPAEWWTVHVIPARENGELHGWVTLLYPAVDRNAPAADALAADEGLSQAQRLARVGAWLWNLEDNSLWWSEDVFDIFGVDHNDSPDYAEFMALVHPDDRELLQERVDAALRGKERYDVRHRIVVPGVGVRYVREQGEVTRSEDGAPLRMLGIVHDITDQTRHEIVRERALDDLAESERRYRLLAENADDVVWQQDSAGIIEWVSESAQSVLGWTQEELRGTRTLELAHPDDRDRAELLTRTDQASGGSGEFRARTSAGTYRWVAVRTHPTPGARGWALVGSLRDIEAEVTMRRELERALDHDPLTGLASRAITASRLSTAILALRSPRASVGVLCVGIDDLSSINAALTHSGGDILLSGVAARIVSVVGDGDKVGRGAGNEINVIVSDLEAAADAAVMADRIRAHVRSPITVGLEKITPTVSIGIATGGRGSGAERLLRDASVAMHQAKADGRDRAEFVDPHLADEARRRLDIEFEIRGALSAGEFMPWYQPIVDLKSAALCGYEALVRWIRPNGEPVEAWRFIPVAERGPLIADIDQLVTRRAVALLADMPAPMFMSVNVSARALSHPNYASVVLGFVSESGADPTRLHLEVTETTLLGLSEHVIANMAILGDAGVSWYVDDFGTGYSSISHLRDLPIAGLKLDRSFTSQLAGAEGTSLQLSTALANLADGLGLDSVAEGVETEDQREILRAQGWRLGQGWLFGKAAPLG